MISRRIFLLASAAATAFLGIFKFKTPPDPDEPVWAWDSKAKGLFVGTRKWLPEHLHGKETVGLALLAGQDKPLK